jgi:hypothetical protein
MKIAPRTGGLSTVTFYGHGGAGGSTFQPWGKAKSPAQKRASWWG